jgi:hypothetical protein
MYSFPCITFMLRCSNFYSFIVANLCKAIVSCVGFDASFEIDIGNYVRIEIQIVSQCVVSITKDHSNGQIKNIIVFDTLVEPK